MTKCFFEFALSCDSVKIISILKTYLSFFFFLVWAMDACGGLVKEIHS